VGGPRRRAQAPVPDAFELHLGKRASVDGERRRSGRCTESVDLAAPTIASSQLGRTRTIETTTASATPGHTATARTSPRIDWLLAILSIWLIGGFYVDLWAHAHGEVDDTFFPPWHGFLYSGAASFGLALVIVAILGKPRAVPIRDVLAPPYRLGFLGAALFVAGGVLDLAWHELFGFEVDVEALLSPTHLLLATSGLLMIGAPLRSDAARMTGSSRSWRDAGPFVIPLALALAVFIAFTQYASPIVDPWAAAVPGATSGPPAQIFAMRADGSGQRRLTVVDADTRSPRMSPGGSSLVYALRDGEQYQLHVMGLDGSGDRALTTEGSNGRAEWSPDGTRIVFASDRDGNFEIYTMGGDGANVVRRTDDPLIDWAPA
jgi:hypothetical protein